MHPFYGRMKLVFKYHKSNRHQFCKKHGYSYQTLQAYWNSDKLPPGNVLESLAREYNVSLDALVLGRTGPIDRAAASAAGSGSTEEAPERIQDLEELEPEE